MSGAFRDFERVFLQVPKGWTKGERVEVSKMGAVWIIQRPIRFPIDTGEVAEDVILQFRVEWDLHSWISWWFG